MVEIIYASAEATPFSPQQLTDLLVKARQNNQKLGVSGILLYHRGSFLQVLEGEELVVTALYQKIGKDSRHNRVMVIKRSPISERSFADWSMGFVEVSADVTRKLQGFNPFLNEGNLNVTGREAQLRKVLHGFRAGDWRQLVT